MYIRKIFLPKDDCHLEKCLNLVFVEDLSISSSIMNWVEGNYTLGLVPNLNLIPEGFNIKTLGKKRNINLDYFDINSLNSFDIFLLYIYGEEIHEDPEKKLLLDTYFETYGEKYTTLLICK